MNRCLKRRGDSHSQAERPAESADGCTVVGGRSSRKQAMGLAGHGCRDPRNHLIEVS